MAKKPPAPHVDAIMPPAVLDEGEDPAAEFLEEILAAGGRILHEKYLNDSIIPYTSQWVRRALDELLEVIDLETQCQCNFSSPRVDSIPDTPPLDIWARAMVPVKHLHDSRFVMVLSAMEPDDASDDNTMEHTNDGTDKAVAAPTPPRPRSDVDEDRHSLTSVTSSCKKTTTTTKEPIRSPPPRHDVPTIVKIHDSDCVVQARLQDDERRRRLLQMLDEAAAAAYDPPSQRMPSSSMVPGESTTSTRTSPRKVKLKKSCIVVAPTAPRDIAAVDDGIEIGFSVFDLHHVDGRIEKRPASVASKPSSNTASKPHLHHHRPPSSSRVAFGAKFGALDTTSATHVPTNFGSVFQEMVLVPGVSVKKGGPPTDTAVTTMPRVTSRTDTTRHDAPSSPATATEVDSPPRPAKRDSKHHFLQHKLLERYAHKVPLTRKQSKGYYPVVEEVRPAKTEAVLRIPSPPKPTHRATASRTYLCPTTYTHVCT
ncbi:Aste57867_795 [Aphanomyces stellatus]|uniref:Aste57867_795 protein n=1 Tax=Aphanomyces stellatus TaxID=120398 RepID=A0A485K8S1_9STRA|nr:hypothetical protein As57867_000794 [Aphanomyces stellatus]VFT78019.1 Aste57867_795 [Aphanomyces stellatus]